MPIYEYKCNECGDMFTLTTTIADDASRAAYLRAPHHAVTNIVERHTNQQPIHRPCDGKLVRVYSVSVVPVMQEHWNTAVGGPISSMSQFRSELTRASDEAAERLNMPVNFQPHDPRDRDYLGVTDEGLETYDRSYVRAHAGDPPEPRTQVTWLPPLPVQSPQMPETRSSPDRSSNCSSKPEASAAPS